MEVFRLLFNFLFLLPFIKAQDYNVINFGAVGDGNTDDTQAVRAAMAAANHSHGGRVIFDAGYTFLTGCFNISSNVILDVRGKILGSINASNYEIIPLLPFYGNDTHDGGGYTNGMTKQPLVYSYNANNITITGGGVIDGNGPYWYDCRYKDQPPCAPYGRPRLVQLSYTSEILIENITLKDSPFWTLHLAWTTNVYINNISSIGAGGENLIQKSEWLNNDGIDIDCSVNVTVENSYINVADDAISVKAGWNGYGRLYGRTTENVLVQNLRIDYTGGLAIGSEMSGGVKNVTFKNNVLNNSYQAIMFKTEVGRGGTVEDITYFNTTVYNTISTIMINMYQNQAGDNDTSIPTIKNVIIDTLTGSNGTYLYNFLGLPQSPIQNVYFANINVTNVANEYHRCYNIFGICDSSSVFPTCPTCLQPETCFDASSDCSPYMNFCNNTHYHSTLCDLCRKSCNLCSKC